MGGLAQPAVELGEPAERVVEPSPGQLAVALEDERVEIALQLAYLAGEREHVLHRAVVEVEGEPGEPPLRGGDERVLALLVALEQELPLEDRLERAGGGGEEGGRLRAVGDGGPPDESRRRAAGSGRRARSGRPTVRRCAASSGREDGPHLAAGLAADLARAEVDEALGLAGGAAAPERRLVEDAEVDEQPKLQARRPSSGGSSYSWGAATTRL